MGFDFSINLGNILTVLSFITGGLLFFSGVKTNTLILSQGLALTGTENDRRFSVIDSQLKETTGELKKLGDLMVELTKTQGRLSVIDERMLSQGRRVDSLFDIVNRILLRDTQGKLV